MDDPKQPISDTPLNEESPDRPQKEILTFEETLLLEKQRSQEKAPEEPLTEKDSPKRGDTRKENLPLFHAMLKRLVGSTSSILAGSIHTRTVCPACGGTGTLELTPVCVSCGGLGYILHRLIAEEIFRGAPEVAELIAKGGDNTLELYRPPGIQTAQTSWVMRVNAPMTFEEEEDIEPSALEVRSARPVDPHDMSSLLAADPSQSRMNIRLPDGRVYNRPEYSPTKIMGWRIPPIKLVAENRKILKTFAALRDFRPRWWIYLLGSILISLPVVLTVAMMALPMLVVSIAVDRYSNIPALRPMGEVIAQISCDAFQSEKGCLWEDILKELDKTEGLKAAIQAEVDCDNLPPNFDRQWCDPNALPNAEHNIHHGPPNPIPESAQWNLRVWIEAGKRYNVPWELLAAVHATRSNFGQTDANCKETGGHYGLSETQLNSWGVDGGFESRRSRGAKNKLCSEHIPVTIQIKDQEGNDKEQRVDTLIWGKDPMNWGNQIAGAPKAVPKEPQEFNTKPQGKTMAKQEETEVEEFVGPDSLDSVDSTYTMARQLEIAVAGAKKWQYDGASAAGCNVHPSAVQIFPHSTAGSGDLIAGEGNQKKYDEHILVAAKKYNIPPGLIKGVINQESGFQHPHPLDVNDAGEYIDPYRGLMQISESVFKNYGDPKLKSKGWVDPEANIDAGAAFWSYLVKQYDHVGTAMAAYNAGPNINPATGTGVPVWASLGANPKIIESADHISYSETRKYYTGAQNFAKKWGWDGKSLVYTSAKPSNGKVPYKGAKAKDPISIALGSKNDPCYVAHVYAWYEVMHEWSEAGGLLYGGSIGDLLLAGGKFAWPLQHISISSPFGPRWGRMHEGIDLAASGGTPLFSSQDGTVIYNSPMGGFGNLVVIEHEVEGTLYSSYYAHQPVISPYVRVGMYVKMGDRIGSVGCTGHCFGDHLHFEIHPGGGLNSAAIDPVPFLGKTP